MIFIRYESFREYIRRFPVTTSLLAINIAVFLIMLAQTGVHPDSEKQAEVLIRFGAMVGEPPYDAERWRIVAAMFVHFGFQHLLFNMIALFLFGPPLEAMLGHARYGAHYLIGGAAANLISGYLHVQPVLSAGASGAIFALYGAYLHIGLLRREWMDETSRRAFGYMLAIGLISTFLMRHIDVWGHLGGLAAGFVLMFAPGLRRSS